MSSRDSSSGIGTFVGLLIVGSLLATPLIMCAEMGGKVGGGLAKATGEALEKRAEQKREFYEQIEQESTVDRVKRRAETAGRVIDYVDWLTRPKGERKE